MPSRVAGGVDEALARRCRGCGVRVTEPAVLRCPQNPTPPGTDGVGEDVDHVLEVPDPPGPWPAGVLDGGTNPFLRYRTLLYPYRVARAGGLDDRWFADLVDGLDEAVAEVDGRGFRVTPATEQPELARAVGLTAGARLVVKDETDNVSGSHKARHTFGLLLHLAVLERLGLGVDPGAPLAIASCGNAALGAAVVARAAGRHLEVFIPPWAHREVVARLEALGATIRVCPRRPGERGDPCVAAYRARVAEGAVPAATQAPENSVVLEGAATLGYELADQISMPGEAGPPRDLDRLFVQVGGGALAASASLGLRRAHRLGALAREPALVTTQAERVAPLRRAYERAAALVGGGRSEAAVEEALTTLARHRSRAMWAWESEPSSIASGILDDETYDWQAVVAAMLRTGGEPVVCTEDDLAEAHRLAHRHTAIDVEPTGTAGLAGLAAMARRGQVGPGETVAVIFTGRTRR